MGVLLTRELDSLSIPGAHWPASIASWDSSGPMRLRLGGKVYRTQGLRLSPDLAPT